MDSTDTVGWASRVRARWHRGRPVTLISVAATDAQAVLAELGTSTLPENLREMSLSHPALDLWVGNRGDRVKYVRRVSLRVSAVGPSEASEPLEDTARPRSGLSQRDRLLPTTAYRVKMPLREGIYRHTLNQVIEPGETDRFLISLVTPRDGEGASTYTITLELNSGGLAEGPSLSTSAPVQVHV